MRIATTLEATPQSDARLRRIYNAQGFTAARMGRPRLPENMDPKSLIAFWWFEGFDEGESLNEKRPDHV